MSEAPVTLLMLAVALQFHRQRERQKFATAADNTIEL